MACPSPCSDHEGAAMKEISRGLELISWLQAQLCPLIPLIQADGKLELASYLCQEAMKSLSLSLSILQSGAAQVASEKMKSIIHQDCGGHVKLIRSHKRRRHNDLSVIVTSEPYFDGYQWRKYGQKAIKKSMFQRYI
ncbi:hypothetical protein J5N97_003764 [Dioscorea zingiberensis]|uniref:WRKY domain-containing protein n=1 Tax=Dioscorea zingiberensis TaxID=325984 RepID=A0A9D5D5A7_9LILI|nr:hypothetical protein J5N97_003764 [Dioscorea zingiberensis]